MHTSPILPSALAQLGFATVPGLIAPERVAELRTLAANLSPAAARNALDLPWCQQLARELATLAPVRDALQAAVGPQPVAIQCTLFDKSAARNWLVAWHRDWSLPLAKRHDTSIGAAGWAGWSTKHGVAFAQPPVALLGQVLALRLHLDDCGPEDGALRVRPGSHLDALRTPRPSDAAHVGQVEEAVDEASQAGAPAQAAVGEIATTEGKRHAQGAEPARFAVPDGDNARASAADPADLADRAHLANGGPVHGQAVAARGNAPAAAEQLCPVPAGGALLMRPLLLHASSKSRSGKARRVLHLVFAPRTLPDGLRWRWEV